MLGGTLNSNCLMINEVNDKDLGFEIDAGERKDVNSSFSPILMITIESLGDVYSPDS
jgi:hypothetical protein